MNISLTSVKNSDVISGYHLTDEGLEVKEFSGLPKVSESYNQEPRRESGQGTMSVFSLLSAQQSTWHGHCLVNIC